MTIHLLQATEIRRLVSMQAAIRAVRRALIGIANDEFELPLRLSLGQSSGLVMPVFHRPTRSLVTKSLSLDNQRLPVITGAVTWAAAAATHMIVADAATVTTIRTGAIVGVAVDLLAPADARHLIVFGAGAQAPDQVRAIASVRALRKVTLVSRTLQRAMATAEVLAKEFPHIAFNGTTDARHLADYDLVSCATPATAPLFSIEELAEQVTITAVGSFTAQMHELPPQLLSTCRPIYVDDLGACMRESGEIISALAEHRMSATDMISLGSALSRPGMVAKRAVFKSVGVAPQDWAVMQVINENLSQLSVA